MLKYCYEKWDKSKAILEAKLREITSMIKPYNDGWRHSDEFEQIDISMEDDEEEDEE